MPEGDTINPEGETAGAHITMPCWKSVLMKCEWRGVPFAY